MTALVSFACGVVFALGLGVSGMTRPEKVLGFLDVAGVWDPALAFVMVGAIAVYALVFARARRRPAPLLAPRFVLPTRRDVDARLVVGAAIFGVGWGLAGLCPGPAVVDLATGLPGVVVFVAAMLVGMRLTDRLTGRAQRTQTANARRNASRAAV